jgi:hypothetical protein
VNPVGKKILTAHQHQYTGIAFQCAGYFLGQTLAMVYPMAPP